MGSFRAQFQKNRKRKLVYLQSSHHWVAQLFERRGSCSQNVWSDDSYERLKSCMDVDVRCKREFQVLQMLLRHNVLVQTRAVKQIKFKKRLHRTPLVFKQKIVLDQSLVRKSSRSYTGQTTNLGVDGLFRTIGDDAEECRRGLRGVAKLLIVGLLTLLP